MVRISGSSKGTRNSWPIRVVARVLQLKNTGTSAIDSFAQAVKEFNATSPARPIVLPVSYTTTLASSLIYTFRARLVKALNNEKASVRLEAEKLVEEFNIPTFDDGVAADNN